MAARTSEAAKRRLQLVETQQPDVRTPEQGRDIYAEDRDRIAAIDWDQVHIRGDRSRPVDLPDRPRRPFGLGGW